MSGKTRSGFTLVECALAGAMVLVVVALLGLMAGRTRKMGQLGESMANLRRVGELTGSYANDYQDQYWSYTWRWNRLPADVDADLLRFITDNPENGAAAAQATQIVRRRTGRGEYQPPDLWFPHVNYGGLILAEYANAEFPAPWLVSPGDRCRSQWADDPFAPLENRALACTEGSPRPATPPVFAPFSSSYEVGAVFYSPDSGPYVISQASTHYQYSLTAYGPYGGRRQTEVAYPSQKAFVWESSAWYFGTRVRFSLMPGARTAMLRADGGAFVRTLDPGRWPNVNWGWNPRNPTGAFPSTFTYEPAAWEPPAPNGQPTMSVNGYHRWTRWGLLGRDFDGPEVTQP